MAEAKYMTQEGFDKLQAEIRELKTKGRSEMSKQIQEAREKGDLSENAEYDAAKEAQGLLEKKIAEMDTVIATAKILDESKIDTSKVMLQTFVKIKNVANGAEMIYQIVSEAEADLKAKKLAVSSPIGKGLLGKKVGEKTEIVVPNGKVTFEIVDITLK